MKDGKGVIHTQEKKHDKAYQHNDVLTLNAFSRLKSDELEQHKQLNQLLQPGVLRVEPEEFLRVVKEEKADWLTDVACLAPHSALAQTIAVKLITEYQVDPHEYHDLSNRIYNNFVELKNFDEVVQTINDAIESKEFNDEIQKYNPEIINGKLQTEVPKYQAMNSITNKVIDEYLNMNTKVFTDDFELKSKKLLDKDLATDYCFIGAPASGKSTVSKTKELDTKNSIIYSTDNYRSFQAPDINIPKDKIGKNVFVYSQDWAYMIKEKVENKIKNLNENGKRPNIILDLANFSYAMNDMVNAKKLKTYMIDYYGDSFVGIAERAHNRASDPYADLADKGRYVNTKSLLESHANVSKFLLTGIPAAAVTEVVSTTNGKEELIASIDQKKNSIEIYDIKSFGNFINKKNINVKSKDPVELIYGKNLNNLASHPSIKAEAMLDLLPQESTPYKSGDYKILFTDNISDKQYANIELRKTGDDKIPFLNISDSKTFESKINQNSYESKMMKSIICAIAKQDGTLSQDDIEKFDVTMQNPYSKEADHMINEVVNQYLEHFGIQAKSRSEIQEKDITISSVKPTSSPALTKNQSKYRE